MLIDDVPLPVPYAQLMSKEQTAWALQRPDLTIVTSMIRATRQEVIDALRDHLIADQVVDALPIAYRRGFRAVRVRVTKAQPKSDFAG